MTQTEAKIAVSGVAARACRLVPYRLSSARPALEDDVADPEESHARRNTLMCCARSNYWRILKIVVAKQVAISGAACESRGAKIHPVILWKGMKVWNYEDSRFITPGRAPKHPSAARTEKTRPSSFVRDSNDVIEVKRFRERRTFGASPEIKVFAERSGRNLNVSSYGMFVLLTYGDSAPLFSRLRDPRTLPNMHIPCSTRVVS